MGFALSSSLPWGRIGICWDEGPLPDEAPIEAQVRIATSLLEVLGSAPGNEAMQGQCQQDAARLREDGAKC
eukprot:4754554-Pyramimonas_sp.AAC.1